jgi:hypothetical protein
MELLLLGLAGLGGLALLLQAKPLPSKADAEKAFDTLEKNPLDPDANTVLGKYKAFVMGDYDGAMPYLVNSKDATLKMLAEHELDGGYTAIPGDKVKMGDEWVNAAKKFPALSRIFYDRATQWYVKAWPDLDDTWKVKSRAQGRKLAASRPGAPSKKELPNGWVSDAGVGGKPSSADGSIARTGSYSLKLAAADLKVKNSASIVKTELIPVTGKSMEVSAYVLADGTENVGDKIFVNYFDQGGVGVGTVLALIPTDVPFWSRVVLKAEIPNNIVAVQFGVSMNSKNGGLWVDDVSVKFDGKESLKNGSFEEK